MQGEPFVGRAGRLLTLLIEGIGLTRADVYIANVVKCRPSGQPGSAARRDRDLPARTSRPSSAFIEPAVVVTLGNFATKLLLRTKEGITRLRGQEFPFRDGVLIPVLHPAAVLRNTGASLPPTRADFVTIKRALARARAGA